MTPQHHIIKDTSDTMSRLLQDEFKANGYKRVHIVEEAPKPDAIEGKLPAVSIYLYQISLDVEGLDGNVYDELVEQEQEDGTIAEFRRRRRQWIRLDYLVSAWAQTPEDEQLLLGLVIRMVLDNRVLVDEQLRGDTWKFEDDPEASLPLHLATRLDEGTLARFWGSLQQPVRPAIQIWTVVPIVPSKLTPFTRVTERSLSYRNINDPRSSEIGPSGGGISLTRSDVDPDDDPEDPNSGFQRGSLGLGGSRK